MNIKSSNNRQVITSIPTGGALLVELQGKNIVAIKISNNYASVNDDSVYIVDLESGTLRHLPSSAYVTNLPKAVLSVD